MSFIDWPYLPMPPTLAGVGLHSEQVGAELGAFLDGPLDQHVHEWLEDEVNCYSPGEVAGPDYSARRPAPRSRPTASAQRPAPRLPEPRYEAPPPTEERAWDPFDPKDGPF